MDAAHCCTAFTASALALLSWTFGMFGGGQEGGEALSVTEQGEHLVAGVASNPGVLCVFQLDLLFYETVSETDRRNVKDGSL